MDGRYSRMSGKASPFGAFLDSTLDRIEEGVVLAAVAVYFSRGQRPGGRRDRAGRARLADGVLSRARAEALGVECKVGIADRAVRVVILSAGLVFGDLLNLIAPAVSSWPRSPSSRCSSASGTSASS